MTHTHTHTTHSPVLSVVLMLGSLISLLALIVKRHDTPTNYYLLATFVSSHTKLSPLCVCELSLSISADIHGGFVGGCRGDVL